MTRSVDNAAVTEERRSSSKDLIQKLTAERTEVIALFCRVAGLEPYSKQEHSPEQMQALLQSFCQLLVDYIAAGHFSLYERIVNGRERRRGAAKLAEQLYPSIADTTEIALDFNDKYDCEDQCQISDDFEQDLSKLGQALASRIELEDKLLRTLI